uniref:Uncharacterized protein n=1 Tax=Lutzomyia longipalpis TaxID=7200 RepID=A0A1B0GGX0_LUTLO
MKIKVHANVNDIIALYRTFKENIAIAVGCLVNKFICRRQEWLKRTLLGAGNEVDVQYLVHLNDLEEHEFTLILWIAIANTKIGIIHESDFAIAQLVLIIILIVMSAKLSSLSIDSINDRHRGNFSCLVSNKAGKTFHTAELKVNGSQKEHEFTLILWIAIANTKIGIIHESDFAIAQLVLIIILIVVRPPSETWTCAILTSGPSVSMADVEEHRVLMDFSMGDKKRIPGLCDSVLSFSFFFTHYTTQWYCNPSSVINKEIYHTHALAHRGSCTIARGDQFILATQEGILVS